MDMSKVRDHIGLLGREVRDRVTGFAGVVTTVGFDLYGCIQAVVTPGVDGDGKPGKSEWYDVNRLKVQTGLPVMDPPNFESGPVAEGSQGAAEKPAYPCA